MHRFAWSIMPVLLAGCVSSGEYERVRTQYDHLKEVKTEWEIEKDDLSQRVDAVQRAYSNVSKDQGALQVQQEQAKTDIARVRDDARVLAGKVASQETQMSALDQKFNKVLERLGLLAETNEVLANRVESLIDKLGALTAAMTPVRSKISKGKEFEKRKTAAAKVEAHRAEEAMRQQGIKGGTPVAGNEAGKAAAPVKNTQARATPPSGALTFSAPPPAGSGEKSKGEKSADGTQK